MSQLLKRPPSFVQKILLYPSYKSSIIPFSITNRATVQHMEIVNAAQTHTKKTDTNKPCPIWLSQLLKSFPGYLLFTAWIELLNDWEWIELLRLNDLAKLHSHTPWQCHWSVRTGTSSPDWCSHFPKCPARTKVKSTLWTKSCLGPKRKIWIWYRWFSVV